ncbi:glycosyltransferase family 2 protein [Aquirufa sp. ROCK-SH2]
MDFSKWDKHLYGYPSLSKKPKLSICLITYNHEEYFENCIENILSQKINFEIEIIIGEDCSTDNTAKIVEKYALKHPTLIKAFIRPINLGAKTNFLHCFFQCKGEYVLFIEADDYFTDENKLQIQVDFLDKHQNTSACFHNALIVYEDNSNRKSEYINSSDQKILTETKDFFKQKETWFMATASVMMRRKYVEKLPEWFLNCKSGDIPMYVILAENAPIAYINKTMSVYRKNLNGQSYTDHTHSIDFIKNRIYMYSKLNGYTNQKYQVLIKAILSDYYKMAISCQTIKPYLSKRIFYLLKSYWQVPPKNKKELFADIKFYLFSEKFLIKYLNLRSKLNQFFKISQP